MLNVGSNDSDHWPSQRHCSFVFVVTFEQVLSFDYYSYFPPFLLSSLFPLFTKLFFITIASSVYFLSLLCLLLSYGGGYFPCQQRKILYCLFLMSIFFFFFFYLLCVNVLCMIASLIYLRFRKFMNFDTDRFHNFFVPLCLRLSCVCSLY